MVGLISGARWIFMMVEIFQSIKPKVANITFSTVTSATGLPTIAAEPNKPRSSRLVKLPYFPKMVVSFLYFLHPFLYDDDLSSSKVYSEVHKISLIFNRMMQCSPRKERYFSRVRLVHNRLRVIRVWTSSFNGSKISCIVWENCKFPTKFIET